MQILNCAAYLILSGLLVFFLGRIFPRKWIKANKFPFKSYKWEREGKIYDKLKIKRWKTRLPDASVIVGRFFPKFLPKKRIDEKVNNNEKIATLIKESCVAEGTHFLSAVLGLYCAKLCKRWGTAIAIFWGLWNLPFILIQRYNRPRLIATHNKLQAI